MEQLAKKKYAIHLPDAESGDSITAAEIAKLWNVDLKDCEIWGVTIPETDEAFENYIPLSKMEHDEDYIILNS